MPRVHALMAGELGYAKDSDPENKEHLWFQAHGLSPDTIDATLRRLDEGSPTQVGTPFECRHSITSLKEAGLVATILLINGSLRSGSTNGATLRTAIAEAPASTRVVMYEGLGELPHFNPDVEQASLPAPVAALRAQLHEADAVLFSTPEYAGGLPGSFKNLLDWCVGEGLHEKPVGFINASAHAGGAEHAHAALRTVLKYVNACVVEAACARALVRRDAIDGDGVVTDPAARAAIRAALQALLDHVHSASLASA